MRRSGTFAGLLSLASCCAVFLSTTAAQASPPIASQPVEAGQLVGFDAEQLATATQKDPFAGFTANEGEAKFVVHLGPEASSNDLAALMTIKLPLGWSIATDRVTRSWSVLEGTQAKAYQGSAFAAETSGLFASSTIDQDINSVRIGLVSVPDGTQAVADQEFGPGAVVVKQEDRPQLSAADSPQAAGQTRLSEKNGPFHGGGRFDSGDTCTQGFTMTIGGTHYGLTAGHCGSAGEQVVATGSPYPRIGTMKKSSVNDGQWDTAYYDYQDSGTWSSAVWRGDLQSSTGQQVKGTNVPSSDTTACTDGSFNGENCHVTVDASTFGTTCADFSGFGFTEHVCHLGVVTNQNSTPVQQGGDSGGPVYVAPSSGLRALGSIVGGTSTKGYFETIQSVLSHWGGSIATG